MQENLKGAEFKPLARGPNWHACEASPPRQNLKKRCASATMADRFQWQKSMELRPVPVEGPWYRVVIDLVGPLPRTARGHIYIVSAIDHFTKWAEAAPL